MLFVYISSPCYVVSSPYLTISVVCIPGDKVLSVFLSPFHSLPAPCQSKINSLDWHVPPKISFYLHQTISLSKRKKYPYIPKVTLLPMLFFSSLFLFFPLPPINMVSKFCFPFTYLPCHKMCSNFSTKTITVMFSPFLLP